MDVHVRRAVTEALQERGVDVLTAQADAATELEDSALLDRATVLRRGLFTQDADLLGEATKRQRRSLPFGGVIHAHQLYVTVGQCIHDLEIIAKAGALSDLENRVEFLPL